ncbi:hypothetical protein Tco_1129133 [Tanacetum coccineum]
MANQEQSSPQQEQPFVVAKQVGFNLEDIILNTNNEVSFSISTCGIYGEVGVNTFRNAIGAHYLHRSSEYVAPPSIDIVRKWFETIGYGQTVSVKETPKKSLLPPRWSLSNGINIDYASIFWEDIIIKLNKKQREKLSQWYLKLSNSLLMLRGFHKAQSLELNLDIRSIQLFSKQPSMSSKEATKGESSKAPTGSKTGHLKKKKDSSSTMESNPSQTSVSTPVVTKIQPSAQ